MPNQCRFTNASYELVFWPKRIDPPKKSATITDFAIPNVLFFNALRAMAMASNPSVEICVSVFARGGSDPDLDLANRVEISCSRDGTLEGCFQRNTVATKDQTLGVSWDGVIKFVLKTKEQLIALSNAIRSAFRTESVTVHIVIDDREGTIKTENVDDLAQVHDLLTGLAKALESDSRRE